MSPVSSGRSGLRPTERSSPWLESCSCGRIIPPVRVRGIVTRSRSYEQAARRPDRTDDTRTYGWARGVKAGSCSLRLPATGDGVDVKRRQGHTRAVPTPGDGRSLRHLNPEAAPHSVCDRPPTTRTTLSASAVLASPLRGSHPHQRRSRRRLPRPTPTCPPERVRSTASSEGGHGLRTNEDQGGVLPPLDNPLELLQYCFTQLRLAGGQGVVAREQPGREGRQVWPLNAAGRMKPWTSGRPQGLTWSAGCCARAAASSSPRPSDPSRPRRLQAGGLGRAGDRLRCRATRTAAHAPDAPTAAPPATSRAAPSATNGSARAHGESLPA